MKGTPASSQIIFLENRVKELEEQLDAFEMDGAHAASRITKLEEELGQANLDFFNLGATGFDMKKHIAELNHYVKLVRYIANDYHELSHDKAYNQRDWWKKLCKELMEKHPIEDEQ